MRTGDRLGCVTPPMPGIETSITTTSGAPRRRAQCLLSGARLAHQFGLGRVAQQRADAVAEEGMVVGDDRPHGPGSCAAGIERQEGTYDRPVRPSRTEAQLAAELGGSRPHRREPDAGAERVGDARTAVGDLELEPRADDRDPQCHGCAGSVRAAFVIASVAMR